MTKEEAIKHLKLMQSGARNAIRFSKNDKEISEEERKEDIEIYQDQLEALDTAIKALEQQPCEDCVNRAEVVKAISEDLEIEIEGRTGLEIYQNEVCEIIKNLITNQETKVKALPPVTPTHGTCKDCKHWKDSDGAFRRGIGAESKCPINIIEVYEGNFYCGRFKKRGNENGSN